MACNWFIVIVDLSGERPGVWNCLCSVECGVNPHECGRGLDAKTLTLRARDEHDSRRENYLAQEPAE